MNKRFDAYYVDENNLLIGINDGTDILAGIPMSTVYPTVVPHPTSSAKASLTVSCCLEDARAAIENFDYVQLDFNPLDELEGLILVDLVEAESGKYKIIETIGGDRTAEFGQAVASGASSVLNNVTTATYANGLITITASAGTTPSLKAPSVLLSNDIAGIEWNKTVKLPSA